MKKERSKHEHNEQCNSHVSMHPPLFIAPTARPPVALLPAVIAVCLSDPGSEQQKHALICSPFLGHCSSRRLIHE